MFSKIIASFLILAPLPLVYIIAGMSFAYKGPLTAVYVAAALALAGFCVWTVYRIFIGAIGPWSLVTWIFLAVDLGLLVMTMIPRKI